MRFLFAVLALLFSVSMAQADIEILDDLGGSVVEYINKYDRIANSGQFVEIKGLCVSACTLITGIVPRSRVCVTSGAELGFHMASILDPVTGELVPTEQGTEDMERIYPPYIRAWIRRHGGLHPWVIYMRGRDLEEFYSLCQ